MLAEARRAMRFGAGLSLAGLREDELRTYAIVRAVEIIGEAAAQVSVEARQSIPALPWTDIVGMRNRLIHVYHDVNLEIVLKTLTQDLPTLVEALESALREG
jgi:uncharacterized protein with HEPN domain